MAVQIQLRNDTAANWSSVNPVLAVGELGLESDTGSYKIGNGANDWNTLPYGGVDGASAYEIAVANGFIGSEQDWLNSLVGAGVPAGGNGGQVLSKIDGADYNTHWVDVQGGGSGETVTYDVFHADSPGSGTITQGSLVIWVDGAGNGAQSGVRRFPTDGSGWGISPQQIAGIAASDIPEQQGGQIVITGSLQVNGAPYSQTGFVYVDPNNGQLSNNANTGGNAWNMPIGWVTIGDQGAKLTFLPWDAASQIGHLTDVKINNPQGGETLVYNNQNGSWENGSAGGGASVGDNLFLNGAFDIWQRLPFGQTSITQGGTFMAADRWLFFQEGGSGDRTVSKENLNADLGNDTHSQYYIRNTSSNDTQGNVKLQQKIENVRTAASQQVVISFWAKSNVTVNVSGQFRQFFGSGSTSQDVYSGTSNGDQLQGGAGWKFVQLNATIPNIQGKDIREDSFIAPEIVFQNPGNNSVIDVAQIKMEIGGSATTFKTKTETVTDELVACQRYYYRIAGQNSTVLIGPGWVEDEVNFQFIFQVTMPTTMRILPTFQSNRTWAYLHIGSGQLSSSSGGETIGVKTDYSNPRLVTLHYIRNAAFSTAVENGMARLTDNDHYMEFHADLP